ncbi:hypothetical protein MMC21_004984 [Puttea exsequens]|nr:hypothetical protein [Puttea exsequens]
MPRMPSPIRTGRISPNRSRSGSPISPRVPTPTANDFPTPSGQVFKVTKRDKGLISPAQSAFSFADDDSPGLAISTPPTPPDIYDEKPAMQPMKQGAPGDSSISLHRLDTSSQAELRKKRSQFYTEVFAYKESDASPKEQVYKESIVSAELKTNVIIKDEYELLQDVSQQLSQRYQRPSTSVALTLTHSACMLFGSTFESAYTLTISALPSLLAPTLNKRNAALLQSFLADALGVPPSRGVIRFMIVPDDCLAFNGTTVLGQVENLERKSEGVKHSATSSFATSTAGPPPLSRAPSTAPPQYTQPPPNSTPPTLAPAPSLGTRQSQNRKQYHFTPRKLPLRPSPSNDNIITNTTTTPIITNPNSPSHNPAPPTGGTQSVPLSRAASPSPYFRPSLNYAGPPVPAVPYDVRGWDREKEEVVARGTGLGKRRSFWGVFARGGRERRGRAEFAGS